MFFVVEITGEIIVLVPGAGFEPATSGIGRLVPFLSRL
jgi:hypothetical protein